MSSNNINNNGNNVQGYNIATNMLINVAPPAFDIDLLLANIDNNVNNIDIIKSKIYII